MGLAGIFELPIEYPARGPFSPTNTRVGDDQAFERLPMVI
ncbi:hypothetical protein JCM19235_5362 [Vibrio maritimus]|uniref:Uncharacterized protein n=1 Tax=Vibrio maritimus TaxID=990268 RepID=A0A090RQH2_9VIBR|nr:hypothetical protein JCM19235_5362 [Vibrio maritimus]